ncbi:phenylacetate--CoA ligase family protein [Haloferacaceae archaeon DSL9]
MNLNKWISYVGADDHISGKALKLLPYYKTYRNEYKLIQESESWSRDRLEQYQERKLRDLIEHAYENVPYYRRIFDERDLTPNDIQSLEDLQKLPFLTKEDVRDNLEDLKATNYTESDFEYVKTGGSTGKPLEFCYEDGVTRAKEWAYMKTQWDRVGYNFWDKCVILRGEEVHTDDGQFWDTSLFGRWLVLSSYHMADDRLPQYIAKIREFKPKYIQAYPSVISILARYMDEHDVEPFSSVKAILCGSEKLYADQRTLVEDTLGCRVYSWYGHAERCVLGGECEIDEQRYHMFPQYGIMEIIGQDGNPIHEPGESGEIVGTSLNNYAMPLIRYRTNDIGRLGDSSCKCGRSYQILESVEGRVQEMFIGDDGRPIPLTGAYSQVGKSSSNVKNAQFYQDEPGEVSLRLVVSDQYTEQDQKQILSDLSGRYDGLMFEVEIIDQIERTQSGKKRFLIQELPIEFTDKPETDHTKDKVSQ